ncbi:MAG: hypothetical protein ACRC5R_05230 [Mycoplasmatales bacterium]
MFDTILSAIPALFSDKPSFIILRIGIIAFTIVIAIFILTIVLKKN